MCSICFCLSYLPCVTTIQWVQYVRLHVGAAAERFQWLIYAQFRPGVYYHAEQFLLPASAAYVKQNGTFICNAGNISNQRRGEVILGLPIEKQHARFHVKFSVLLRSDIGGYHKHFCAIVSSLLLLVGAVGLVGPFQETFGVLLATVQLS